MQDPPTLDPAPIAELLELGGPNRVNEVVRLFLGDAPRLLAEIETALGRTDLEALEGASQSLKSSAFYLGAMALSSQSSELESQARAGNVQALFGLVQALPAAFAAAQSNLEQLQSELPPA